MTRIFMGAAGALALVLAGQAAASERLPDGTTTEERANTARLNAEQAARAQAEITAYQQSIVASAQQQTAAAAAYSIETAAYEAEKARIAAMSAAKQLQWEADVAACNAGDASRCAKSDMPPTMP